MTVTNRSITNNHRRWHYDFTIRGRRYRNSIPEARTKAEAIEAETAVRRRVFEGTYGAAVAGSMLFAKFADDVYMPWAKTNKRTWRNDELIIDHALKPAFRGKRMRDISPLIIEKLKRDLNSTETKRGTSRAPASTNMVLSIGSSIFTLACDQEPPMAQSNPFRKVKKLAVDNRQVRYLDWEEEKRLLEVLINPPVKPRAARLESVPGAVATGSRSEDECQTNQMASQIGRITTAGRSIDTSQTRPTAMSLASRAATSVANTAMVAASNLNARVRSSSKRPTRLSLHELKAAQRAHLCDAIPIAVGTGLRRREQTTLRVRHCDFARNVLVVEHTATNPNKTNRLREVPMNDDVRAILRRLCKGRRPDDYLFINPKTKRPYLDFKKGFAAACAEAGIHGLSWKALRHTFATRLGEAGYTAFEIADLMGHSDVRTSQRYVHSTDRRKHEAVQSTMLSRRATA